MWSPKGVAENMQGAKPVRLAAGAFLLCVQKEPKYAWGCAPRPRRVGAPPPGKPKQRLPGAGLDDAYRVPQAHFMLGNCKPIAGSHDVEPMGWISSCLPRRPLPRCGGGEQGGGKYAVATFGAHLCAVRICFSRLLREKQYSYPAQLSVKGVCKGESLVPLCPVLLPFAGAKGRPPRRAVLTMPLQKAPRRRQATTNYPPPGRRTV